MDKLLDVDLCLVAGEVHKMEKKEYPLNAVRLNQCGVNFTTVAYVIHSVHECNSLKAKPKVMKYSVSSSALRG